MRAEQRAVELMHLELQRIVLFGEFQQIVQFLLQFLHALAQGEQLAFAQRDGAPAVRVGQVDLRQHLGVVFEELRVVQQVLCNVFCSHYLAFYKLISPSNTVMAGPVISTGERSPAQVMLSVPPRVATCTVLSSSLRRMPATTAAQAPVPQDRVSPAPRSNTRSLMCVAVHDLHVTGIHALGKARMMFDQRPLRGRPGQFRHPQPPVRHADCPWTRR